MNWVWRLMKATPEVNQWVAAPWILQNTYSSPEFRFFEHPIQRHLGLHPSEEWQMEWFTKNLIRTEKYLPLYRNWLFQQLKSRRPDVLHAHFGPVGCHYLDLAERLKIPLVVSFYGYDFMRVPYEKPRYRARYRQLFERAAALTTTGGLTPKWLLQHGCPPEKITPIPVSLAPSSFPFVQRTKIPGQLRLLQVATITEKKGHLDTLAALKIALQSAPNLHLCIVGERQDKRLFGEIQQFVRNNHLEPHVTLHDFCPPAQLPQWMGQYDVFIHPSRMSSRFDCEGAPLAILEAMATGLPVISTLHADIPMQVLHGQTGFLAPERDPAALASFILHFYHLDNPAYQTMSRAASHHVQTNFEINQTALKLRALYARIANVKHIASPPNS
jgi:colanic acid/amylovoran biosynthesis glycosyltransferase